MRKSEIKKAPTNRLIVDYVRSSAELAVNQNLKRGTERLSKHCTDLEEELVMRGILTDEDVKILNL